VLRDLFWPAQAVTETEEISAAICLFIFLILIVVTSPK
jgi:hypothetical protein